MTSLLPALTALLDPPPSPDCRHVGDYVHHVERAKDMRLDRQDGTGRG